MKARRRGNGWAPSLIFVLALPCIAHAQFDDNSLNQDFFAMAKRALKGKANFTCPDSKPDQSRLKANLECASTCMAPGDLSRNGCCCIRDGFVNPDVYISRPNSCVSQVRVVTKFGSGLPTTETMNVSNSAWYFDASCVHQNAKDCDQSETCSVLYSAAEGGSEKSDGTEDGKPAATDEESGGGISKALECFPGSATVQTEDGGTKRMDSLRIGDRVHVGGGRYSAVFMFTHRAATATPRAFVRIRTACGAALVATAGHYVHADGGLVAAGAVAAGARLTLGSGARARVLGVERVAARGLYNPQTVDGDIVVDGVLASTYTTAVDAAVAHGLLAPARLLYAWFGVSAGALEARAAAASWLPGGGEYAG